MKPLSYIDNLMGTPGTCLLQVEAVHGMVSPEDLRQLGLRQLEGTPDDLLVPLLRLILWSEYRWDIRNHVAGVLNDAVRNDATKFDSLGLNQQLALIATLGEISGLTSTSWLRLAARNPQLFGPEVFRSMLQSCGLREATSLLATMPEDPALARRLGVHLTESGQRWNQAAICRSLQRIQLKCAPSVQAEIQAWVSAYHGEGT